MTNIIDNRKDKNCLFGSLARGDFYMNHKNALCIKTGTPEGFSIENKQFMCQSEHDVVTPVNVEISIVD